MVRQLPRTSSYGEITKSRQAAGFVLTETTYQPGVQTPRHSHELGFLYTVLDGSFTESLGRIERDGQPLTLALRPAGEAHSHGCGTRGARLLNLYPISPDRFEGCSNLLCEPDDIRGAAVPWLVSRLYREFQRTDTASSLLIEREQHMKAILALGLFGLAAITLPRHSRCLKGGAPGDSPLCSENASANAFGSAVDGAARAFMGNQQTVGLSIGVSQDGKAFTYNFGSTERGKQRPPTAHTRYAIASITRTFTGTLLAQAVVEKKVRLDDDVRQYLDGDYPNLEYDGQPVRLWQLINHTSGLPRSLPENVDSLIGQDEDAARRSLKEAAFLETYTREDFLRDLHRVRLTRVPGESFSYSGAAAQLLGLVLERVYGKSYEELVRIKITRPLKMNDTKVTLTAAERARLPRGYSGGDAFLPALSTRLPAAGSLFSTTADMLKYIAWNLAEKDDAVKLAHQPAGNTIWRQDNSFTVGLNWQILRSPGQRKIFQDGSVPGFHSMCVLYPELNLGIIVLANEEVRSMPASLSPLINQILKTIDPRVATTP